MIAALALSPFACQSFARAAGLDPAQMSADEIKALQHRLTDAGCYNGAIDGAPASSALDDAIKACPDQRPFLRIEIGMHTAPPIWAIGADAACRTARNGIRRQDRAAVVAARRQASAGHTSADWRRRRRPDLCDGAVAGWTLACRRRFGRRLRKLGSTASRLSTCRTARFGASAHLRMRSAAVTFSPDGRRIAVGLGGTSGLRVLDSATGAELLADRDYGDGVSWACLRAGRRPDRVEL